MEKSDVLASLLGYWFIFAASLGMILPIVIIGLVQNPNDNGEAYSSTCTELYRFCIFVLAAYTAFAVAGLMRLTCGCVDFFKSQAVSWTALISFIILGPVAVMAAFFYAIVIEARYSANNYYACSSTVYLKLGHAMAIAAIAVPCLFMVLFAIHIISKYCARQSADAGLLPQQIQSAHTYAPIDHTMAAVPVPPQQAVAASGPTDHRITF